MQVSSEGDEPLPEGILGSLESPEVARPSLKAKIMMPQFDRVRSKRDLDMLSKGVLQQR